MVSVYLPFHSGIAGIASTDLRGLVSRSNAAVTPTSPADSAVASPALIESADGLELVHCAPAVTSRKAPSDHV
jgi:hypothetical protein